MFETHIRPSGDLRNHYPQMVDLLKQQDHIVITRNGRGEAILMGMEVYGKFQEFLHEEYIAKKLAESEAYAARLDAKRYTIEEAEKLLGL